MSEIPVLIPTTKRDDPTIQIGLFRMFEYMNSGTPTTNAIKIPQNIPFSFRFFLYRLKTVGTMTQAAIVLNIHQRCLSPN